MGGKLTKEAMFIAILVIIVISFAIGAYLYPMIPQNMPSHWNYKGDVDGYLPKQAGLFLIPAISIGLLIVFVYLPKIDPLRKNVERFNNYFYGFILVLMLFFLYLHLLTIAWSLGLRFNIIKLLAPAFGVLFYTAGVLISKSKRNWFIGIKTPWTLSNEKVWDKTHAIGGRLFALCAVLAVVGVIFPDYAIFLIIVPVLVSAIFLIWYSYFLYKKETAKKRK